MREVRMGMEALEASLSGDDDPQSSGPRFVGRISNSDSGYTTLASFFWWGGRSKFKPHSVDDGLVDKSFHPLKLILE